MYDFFLRALGSRKSAETAGAERPYADALDAGIRSGRDAKAWLDAMNERADDLEKRDLSPFHEFCAEMRKLGYRVEYRLSRFDWYGGNDLDSVSRKLSLVVDYNASDISVVYKRNDGGRLSHLYWNWPHRLGRKPYRNIVYSADIAKATRQLALAIGEEKGAREDILPAQQADREEKRLARR